MFALTFQLLLLHKRTQRIKCRHHGLASTGCWLSCAISWCCQTHHTVAGVSPAEALPGTRQLVPHTSTRHTCLCSAQGTHSHPTTPHQQTPLQQKPVQADNQSPQTSRHSHQRWTAPTGRLLVQSCRSKAKTCTSQADSPKPSQAHRTLRTGAVLLPLQPGSASLLPHTPRAPPASNRHFHLNSHAAGCHWAGANQVPHRVMSLGLAKATHHAGRQQAGTPLSVCPSYTQQNTETGRDPARHAKRTRKLQSKGITGALQGQSRPHRAQYDAPEESHVPTAPAQPQPSRAAAAAAYNLCLPHTMS